MNSKKKKMGWFRHILGSSKKFNLPVLDENQFVVDEYTKATGHAPASLEEAWKYYADVLRGASNG